MARIIVPVIVSFLFLFIAVNSSFTSFDVYKYFFMVTEVHYYYKTSCVVFVLPRDYTDLNTTSLVHKWSFELSRRGILTMAVTVPNLIVETERYQKHILRPLYVVLLDTKESMADFAVTTKHLIVSYPVWFIIFMQSPGNPLENVCLRPSYNVFNLTFDTEMLVLCYNNSILKEWYAVRDNRTRVFGLASWTRDKGLRFHTEDSLYARRSDMFGETMRVATVEESPFTTTLNGTLSKFFGDVMTELSKAMNFNIKILDSAETYGSWNNDEQRWTGVIGQLIDDKADVGVAEFTITNQRLDVVDFTLPLLLSRNRLYVKQPDASTIQWSGYFKAFSMEIWAVIIFIIVASPILLTFIKTKGYIVLRIMTDNYIHVWGIYCQQGLSEFPSASSLRLAFLSIFVSALIVSSAYSASLISFLTVTTTSLPFSTFEEFAVDGSYNLIVFRSSADYDTFVNAKDIVLLKMFDLMKEEDNLPTSLMEGFEMVCTEKVGFYTTEAIKNTISLYLPCQVTFIESGRADSLAVALTKDNPYTGLMNYHLQRFQDNGMLNRIRNKYFVTPNPSETMFHAVELWGIVPILAILAGGTVLGGFILLIERMYYMFRNKRKIRLDSREGLKPKHIIKPYSEMMRKDVQKMIKLSKRDAGNCKKPTRARRWP